MLAGFVYCADCQKAMTRQKQKEMYIIIVEHIERNQKKLCTKHSIKEQTILKVVLTVLQNRFHCYIIWNKLQKKYIPQHHII